MKSPLVLHKNRCGDWVVLGKPGLRDCYAQFNFTDLFLEAILQLKCYVMVYLSRKPIYKVRASAKTCLGVSLLGSSIKTSSF